MELTARLLDVTPNSSFENVLTDFTTEVILPLNRGILGHVARSKRPLNIIDATKVTSINYLEFYQTFFAVVCSTRNLIRNTMKD